MVQYQKPGVVKILHQDWKLIQKHHLTITSAEKNTDGKKHHLYSKFTVHNPKISCCCSSQQNVQKENVGGKKECGKQSNFVIHSTAFQTLLLT